MVLSGGRTDGERKNIMNKQETYAFLDSRGIKYEVTEHPAVFNMAEMAQIELPHPEADAKNLFLRDDKRLNYYLITVRGDKRVDVKKFRRDNGTRPLTFASPEELSAILSLTPGSVTPLGLLNDGERRVKLYIDSDLFSASGLVGVHPNDNTATVWMKTDDLERLVREHGNEVFRVAL